MLDCAQLYFYPEERPCAVVRIRLKKAVVEALGITKRGATSMVAEIRTVKTLNGNVTVLILTKGSALELNDLLGCRGNGK